MKSRTYSVVGVVIVLCFGIYLYNSFLQNNDSYTLPTASSQTDKDVSKIDTEIQPFSILFLGDAMFDRWVRDYMNTPAGADIFKNLRADITNADLTVLNLEGPITESASVASYNNLRFTFPTTTATLLRDNGIDVVSLANNHSHNFGRVGLAQTRSFLDAAGVAYFGDAYNTTSTLSYVYKKNDVEIAFVGYHAFENPDLEAVLAEIRTHKSLGRTVVFFPHWGNEYQKKAGVFQRDAAQQVVDAGADIIIGAHPHVVQNIEVIKSTPVIYSLGNFIFDQWFSKDVQEELAVKVWIDPSSNMITSLELIPLVRTRYVPEHISNPSVWCMQYTASSSVFTRFFTESQSPCILKRAYE